MKTPVLSFIFLVVFTTFNSAQQVDKKAALESMVATEKAFAATCLKVGIRASFLQFFADSALAFSPEPFIYKQIVAKQPPQADPLARTLKWDPVAGDISASGDLGYLMGPSTMTDNTPKKSPTQYGFYLSIWKKQGDGTWKVIIDIGSTVSEKITSLFGEKFIPLGNKEYSNPSGNADKSLSRKELMEMDRSFTRTVSNKGIKTAYMDMLDNDARAIRDGVGPVIGIDSILAYIHEPRFLEPINSDVSIAGDLGYTYGAYRGTATSTKPDGYYIRIWKKISKDVWKIVVDKEAPVEKPE
jgi:ketosteroid isomerase-like protein